METSDIFGPQINLKKNLFGPKSPNSTHSIVYVYPYLVHRLVGLAPLPSHPKAAKKSFYLHLCKFQIFPFVFVFGYFVPAVCLTLLGMVNIDLPAEFELVGNARLFLTLFGKK